jgi:3-hydroxybutyryl-CoA dehydratase
MKRGDLFVSTFVVDWKTYNGFICVFNDTNPLHTDDQYAREKGFAEKVMHGNILNGFLSYFIGELLPLKNTIIHSQSIQYKKPVYLDDKLLFEAKVEEVFESVGAVEITYVFRNTKRNQVSAKGKIQIGILLNKD